MRINSSPLRSRLRLHTIFAIVSLLVVILPLGSIFFFRIYENMLVRQTELELISQAAVISASYKQAVEQTTSSPSDYGRFLTDYDPQRIDTYYTPTYPQIDLASSETLPPRPDGEEAAIPDSTALQLQAPVAKLIRDIQKQTLSGILVLDYNGTTIAGQGDTGKSFRHVPEVKSALSGHYKSVIRDREIDFPNPAVASISRGTGIRVFVAYPIIYGKQLWGIAYLSRTPPNILKHLYEEKDKVMLAGLTILAITLFISLFTTYMVTRPIHRLIGMTKRVSEGDTETIEPLLRPATREVEQLSNSFSAMTKTLKNRTDYIREFATHVSHEFKTPLTSIRGATELLQEHSNDMPAEQKQKFLQNIIEDTDRLKQLVSRLLELARADNLKPSNESAVPANVIAKIAPRYDEKLTLTVIIPPELAFRISSENLETVLVNLFDNALQHGASTVTLTYQAADNSLTIADNGNGISPANQDKIFTPFFTTTREMGGTGIGLRIVQSILQTHQAEINLCESKAGAKFRISFIKST